MKQRKEPVNPFYVLLVVVGAAFVVSACGFTLMCLRDLQPAAPTIEAAQVTPGSALMTFFRDHGITLLLVEVGLIGVLSFAAMALDSARQRRAARSADEAARPSSPRLEPSQEDVS